MTQFLTEVLHDLSQTPKRLNSKYFYDEVGDVLFQQIMACEDYYLTRCETEIFETFAADIAIKLKAGYDEFDLIELGAGDASKTIHLLKQLTALKTSFTYLPIDISTTIIRYLEDELPRLLPGLAVQGLNGEYLDMLRSTRSDTGRRRVVLFLGSNIGNMEPQAALRFCREVRATLNEGDMLLIGFDLKKTPATVLAAYNDREGITKAFNLNLLQRINRDLGGDFVISQFEHQPTYDPVSGACKSYLLSLIAQDVHIDGHTFHFGEGETIHMEISQKYTPDEIDQMARDAGFTTVANFVDSKSWFVDTIWRCGANSIV